MAMTSLDTISDERRARGPRRARLLAIALLSGGVAVAALPVAAQVQRTGATVRLVGHAFQAPPGVEMLPRPADADQQPLTFTVVLKMRDSAEWAQFKRDYYDRNSPEFHQGMPADELTERFGPTQATYDAVRSYLVQQGFKVVQTSENRRTLTVRGTRAMTERALSVRIADFARGAARIHATLDDPAVPADLASSIAVIDGLTTMPGHHPNGLTAPSPATPQSVATAYNAYGFYGLSAKGQTVAIYSESNFVPSDVQNFLSYSGLPASLYSNVSTVTIPSNVSVGLTSSTGQAEVTNDIDTILGFAPGASVVVVMNDTSAGNTYSQVYNALFEAAQGSSRMGGIVSQSWTSCEVNNSSAIGIQNTVDSLVETASMSGTTVFVASGDTGNAGDSECQLLEYPNSTYPNGFPNVEFPADLPHVVSVGGTTLYTTASGSNAYGSEIWFAQAGGQYLKPAGGFGTSATQLAPSWQGFYSVATHRSVPDVAADADPTTGITTCLGTTTNSSGQTVPMCGSFGGTSLAAPIWAATWALVNAQTGPLTAGNGNIYYISEIYTQPGTNYCAALMHSPWCLPTGLGTDFQHLGLGSPNISNLISALTGKPYISTITPDSGSEYGGTVVTVTGYELGSATQFRIDTFLAANAYGTLITGATCTNGTTCTFTMPAESFGWHTITPFDSYVSATASPSIGGRWGPTNPATNFEDLIPIIRICYPFCRYY
jgi:subtilase family serine protease